MKLNYDELILLSQGAEAKIWLDKERKVIIKERVPKGYRIKELDDELRKKRTRMEIRILNKASKVINVPKVMDYDDFTIIMEYIDGKKLRDVLNEDNYKQLLMEVGKIVAKLHNANIIHQDLTTSNMILKNEKIYLIDFGLSFISQRIEDKGVDLHLLKEALESKHFELKDAFDYFLEGYKNCEKFDEVIERLKKIEERGRYKHK